MRFAEELLLLLFDERADDLSISLPAERLHILLAGAVLMDLALEERIDTDLKRLMLVDPTPLNDDLLDPVLADIARAPETSDTDTWVRRQAERGEAIREGALARLTARGILESTDSSTFFLSRRVSRARRYRPSADETVRDEVRLRIMRVLFSDDIPDPRDTVIICLAAAGGIFERILSRSELADVQDRIDLVKKLDLIGQSVARAVRAVEPPSLPFRSPRGTEIPRAPGLPVLGNALSLRADAGDFLLKQYRALGPIFRVFFPGLIDVVGLDENGVAAVGDLDRTANEDSNGTDAGVFEEGR